MGRFDERATRPQRGPADMLRWKLVDPLRGRRRRDAEFDRLDELRPGVRLDGAARFAATDAAACWIGHATWLLHLAGLTIATDPIWSRSIGGMVSRLVPPGISLDDLPGVDVVCISHDHRDHMDLPTLRRLGPEPLYVVPLGNGRRLAKLGFSRVVELDWWESHVEGDLTITLVPARHWSMRAPWNRNDTLWGGFVLRAPEGVAYHAGDTAAGEHFAEIAARVGPIDWAMLPIGGYAPRWFMEPQHICPEEAGDAFVSLAARHLFAMHWGTFRLTDEAVGEPAERLRAWSHAHRLPDSRLWLLDVGEVLQLGAQASPA